MHLLPAANPARARSQAAVAVYSLLSLARLARRPIAVVAGDHEALVAGVGRRHEGHTRCLPNVAIPAHTLAADLAPAADDQAHRALARVSRQHRPSGGLPLLGEGATCGRSLFIFYGSESYYL